MPSRRLNAVIAIACLAAALPAARAAAATPLLAGAAAADITPPITSPMFAYTARSYVFSPGADLVTTRGEQIVYDPDTGYYAKTFRASDGIHTRVLSRALVLQQGTTRYALVQADLGGLPYALTQEVVKRIADTGISADHLLLSATHTHSSTGAIWPADNSGYAFVGGDAFDPRIFELTAEGISQAIHAAVARLEPARAGFGTAVHRGASRNRAYDAFLLDKDIPSDPAEQHLASTDPTFTVLRVDALDGRPIAAWSNFAVHPTSFDDDNHLFSGDGAGVAARIAESTMAEYWKRQGSGRDPGAPAPVDVWTNGAQGDISPDGDPSSAGGQQVEYDPTEASHADLAGQRDATGILEAWRAAANHMSSSLPIKADRTLISFDGSSYGADGGMQEPVGPFPILGLGVVDENQCAPVNDMAGPGQGNKAPLYGGPGAAPDTFPVSMWRIGGLGIAAFPAEITKQMGQRIRDDLFERAAGRLDHIALAGLTNGYISYTTTPEEYDSCDYEASFTLFGREEGYAWMAFGRQLESALLDGAPLSSKAEPVPLGVGTAQTTPYRATADAGTITAQPAPSTNRYGRAVFKWTGGDQQIDPARGRPFVSLQLDDNGTWRTVGTEDSPADTTQRANGEWTETWQFDQCSPLGRYRFSVQGVAVRKLGDAPSSYTAVSQPFDVGPIALATDPPTVTDGVASVRALYPDPGAGAILSLPRLLMGGRVQLHLSDKRTVKATDPDGDGVYTAPVGSASVTSVHAADACGNSS
jgi:neutral ceramidase